MEKKKKTKQNTKFNEKKRIECRVCKSIFIFPFFKKKMSKTATEE